MKKHICTLFFFAAAIPMQAQFYFNLNGRVDRKISSWLNEGSKVELKAIIKKNSSKEVAVVKYGEQLDTINLNELDKVYFTTSNIKEFWQAECIRYKVYNNLFNNGFQYKLRKDLEEEALDFIEYANSGNLIFEDSYLESYLYALLYRLYPQSLDDNRPGILNIKILKDNTPNAFIFSNGTLFITTGLISTINSEQELLAVLAHEVSHFVLDHAVININKAVTREKRAAFWAAFATGIAAAADIYAASKNEYYMPGILTMGTAVLASSAAESISERFGLKYSREQEMEADRCAVDLLRHIKVDPLALSSVLSKIKTNCILNGDYLALTGEGNHPALDDRIKAIGTPVTFIDTGYDKKVSLVNTFNAALELNNQHFKSCKMLAERNISSNIATEEDYVMLALVTLYMYDTPESNQEALRLITKAKQLSIYPTINMAKVESLVHLRLAKGEDARRSLAKYKELLDAEFLRLEKIKDPKYWTALNTYLTQEYEWTRKMINKAGKI